MPLKFPKYWAKGVVGGVSCWWWSDRSFEDAKQLAHAKAIELAERIRLGVQRATRASGYGYGDRPLREQVLEELFDRRGEPSAVLTRNSYGSLVLNTTHAMFIDVDLPEPEAPRRGLFQLLFSKRPPPDTTLREAALTRISRWIESNHGFGARLYETKAGLRVLIVHDLFEPNSPAAAAAFEALNADPLYRKLCERQHSFRARVSPKPWRCGASHPPSSWPFENPRAEADFKRWLKAYEKEAPSFASCHFLRTIGTAQPHPELAAIIELHDRLSAAQSGLPLA